MEALAALVFGLTRTPVWMFGVALAVLFVLSPRFDFQYEGWQMHGSQTQLTLAAIMLYAILRGIRYVISRAGKLRGQQTPKIDVRFWEEALADRMLRQVFWSVYCGECGDNHNALVGRPCPSSQFLS